MIDLATLSAPERRAREIERFRAMAAARPDDAVLRLHLANLLLADGRGEEATAEFDRLRTMNADGPVRAQAGRSLLDAGRYTEALLFLHPAEAPLDRALALLHTAGPDAALAALAQAPQSSESQLLKARILANAGRTDEALQLLTASPAWPGARPQLIEEAALFLASHGRFADATRILVRGLADAPASRDLLLSKAVVLALDGRTSEAEKDLRRLEERWPEWHLPYRFHALMLATAKRTQEAAPLLRTAAALSTAEAGCQSLRDWLTPACRGAAR